MRNEISWRELTKYLAGECAQGEEEELLAWAASDPARAEMLKSASTVWLAAGAAGRRWDTDEAWSRVQERVASPPAAVGERGQRCDSSSLNRAGTLHAGLRGWAIAAGLAAILATGVLGPWIWTGASSGKRPVAFEELITGMGERAQIRLSDGSHVALGPETRLRITSDFRDTREVHLSGEAYFEVAGDPSRPFDIVAGGTVTRVLGTEFGVRAYPADSIVRVVVAEGRVSFRSYVQSEHDASVLLAGELAELERGSGQVTRRRVHADSYLGWRQGRLVFDSAPLSQVAIQLERWYGVPVRIADPTLGERRLSAAFRDEPVDEVMAVIAASLGLEWVKLGQVYTFAPKGTKPTLARF
jgi:transmembrane sensor